MKKSCEIILSLIIILAFCSTVSAQSQPAFVNIAPTPLGGTVCTPGNNIWFAAPTAHGNGSGTSYANADELSHLDKNHVSAGSIICLDEASGSYNQTDSSQYEIPQSGNSSAGYIVYRPYDLNGPRPLIKWAGSSSGSWMFNNNNKSYIEITGLEFDGNNAGGEDILAAGHSGAIHHLHFYNLKVHNMAYNCIATNNADYVEWISNQLYKCGYLNTNVNQSSGITPNEAAKVDSAAGFHTLIIGNVISGQFDGSSPGNIFDGNGISLDLSSSGNTSGPTLVANNLIYNNSGRCILDQEQSNAWIVNNTCYKNGLYTSLDGSDGEIQINDKSSGAPGAVVINNIAWAWWNRPAYVHYDGNGNISTISHIFRSNESFEGSNLRLPTADTGNTTHVFNGNPLFVNPPVIQAYPTNQQNSSAIAPWNIGNSFYLQSSSPAIGNGIDPTTFGSPDTVMISQLRKWVGVDLAGAARPQNKRWDLGAYVYGGSIASTPVPTQSSSPSIKPGDTNNDNKVDGLDYVVWLNHYGQNISGSNNGDFNTDGKVDGLDYVIWVNNYGK